MVIWGSYGDFNTVQEKTFETFLCIGVKKLVVNTVNVLRCWKIKSFLKLFIFMEYFLQMYL